MNATQTSSHAQAITHPVFRPARWTLGAAAVVGITMSAGSAEAAGRNEIKFRTANDSAGTVVCLFNQRDSIKKKVQSAAYIPPGITETLDCKAGKGFLGFESKADSCRVATFPDISPQDLIAMFALDQIADLMVPSVPGMPMADAAVSAYEMSKGIDIDNLCDPIFHVINPLETEKVKKNQLIEVQRNGTLQPYDGSFYPADGGHKGSELEMTSSEPRLALGPGEFLLSEDGRFKFVMQGDGNLVLYKYGMAIWATNTAGFNGFQLYTSMSLGLELLHPTTMRQFTLWLPNYHEMYRGQVNRSRLVLQNDGNVVLYRHGQAIWDTGTWHHN